MVRKPSAPCDVARVLPPDGTLLVPFLAVVLQRFQAIGSRAGVEVAEGQNGPHCVDAIGEPELRHHDDLEALRPHLLLAGAAGAPFRNAAIMRQAVLPTLEVPAALTRHALHLVEVVRHSLAAVLEVAGDAKPAGDDLEEPDHGVVADADVPGGVDRMARDSREAPDARLLLGLGDLGAVIGALDRSFEGLAGRRGIFPLHVLLLGLGLLDVPSLLSIAEVDAVLACELGEVAVVRVGDFNAFRVQLVIWRFPPREEMELEVERRERNTAALLRSRCLAQFKEMALLALGRALDKHDLP